jgi:hypothetical protein
MEKKTAGQYDRNARPLSAEKKLKVEKSPLASFLSFFFKTIDCIGSIQAGMKGMAWFFPF